MKLRSLILMALTFVPAAALAHADLSVSISTPGGAFVYQSARYTVQVANIGNKNANSGSLTIQLPVTHTSPTVHILGTLGARSAGCNVSGTRLLCALPAIRRNQSASFFFDLAIPQSAVPSVITATAAMSSGPENTLANNTASHTANLANYAYEITEDVAAVNRHCTGQGLISFFECELYPSSISSHSTTLHFDVGHTISFGPEAGPTYSGEWQQAATDELTFQYYEDVGNGPELVADFSGFGVGGDCFEGITTFYPPSPYMSVYEVCLTPAAP